MADKHSVLFIGLSASLETLKRNLPNTQNLIFHHVDAAAAEDSRAQKADIVIVEHLGNHDNTGHIFDDVGIRMPDSILLLHVNEKLPPDKLIHYMNSGARDVFTNDDNPELVLRKAVSILEKRTAAQSGESVRAGRAITFFSSKGGVGKTFLASVAARLLGQSPEYKTLIIDLDLQFGDVDLYLNASSNLTIGEMVEEVRNNSDRLTDFILDGHIHKLSPSLHLLSAPLSPEKSDLITAQDVSNLLKMVRKRYNFVVIDTNTILNDVTLTVFDKIDRLFIVVDNEIASAKNAGQMFQLLKKANYSENKIDFIVNRAGARFPLSDDVLLKMLSRAPYAKIPESDKIAEAINQGYDIVEKAPGDPYVESVRKFLVALLKEWDISYEALSKAQKGGGGFMSFFLAKK